jgi:DNA-binding NarL/FixJ family response regulator
VSVFQVKKSAHRIVYECFCGLIPEGMEINHKNGNKLDNRIANLEVVTRQQNMRHAYDTRLLPNVPARASFSKLSSEGVQVVKYCLSKGQSHSQIARSYGVSVGTITNIAKGRSWKDVS